MLFLFPLVVERLAALITCPSLRPVPVFEPPRFTGFSVGERIVRFVLRHPVRLSQLIHCAPHRSTTQCAPNTSANARAAAVSLDKRLICQPRFVRTPDAALALRRLRLRMPCLQFLTRETIIRLLQAVALLSLLRILKLAALGYQLRWR